jgi:hypothetical protein
LSYVQLKKNARSFRSSVSHTAAKTVTSWFGLDKYLDPNVRRKVAANLIKDANHVWAQVAFQTNGELLEYHGVRSVPPYRMHEVAADLTQHSIRHGQFRHPSLIDTILNAAFLGNRPPAVTQPKSLNPIPLPTIAFACTVVSGAAYNHLTG